MSEFLKMFNTDMKNLVRDIDKNYLLCKEQIKILDDGFNSKMKVAGFESYESRRI